jgi:hypothetical protein
MANGYVLGAVAAVSLVLAWRWRRHVATWKAEDFVAAVLFPLALAFSKASNRSAKFRMDAEGMSIGWVV